MSYNTDVKNKADTIMMENTEISEDSVMTDNTTTVENTETFITSSPPKKSARKTIIVPGNNYTHKYATRSKVKPKDPPKPVVMDQTESMINNIPSTSSKKQYETKKQPQESNINKKQKLIKKEPSPSKRKGKEPEAAVTTTRQEDDNNDNEEEGRNIFTSLPPEILRFILSNLTVYDLYNLSLANKKLLNIVQCQPIWQHILIINKKKIPKRHDSMYAVLKQNSKLCDECLHIIGPTGSKAPVKIAVQFDHVLKLCLTCRRHYYDNHPEDINDIARKVFSDMQPDENAEDKKITKSRAKDVLKLNDVDLNGLPHINARNPYGRGFVPMVLYHVDDLLEVTLHKHGGYAGLLAERQKSEIFTAKRAETIRIKHEAHQREADKRKAILVEKLAEKGLQLRSDSVLCDRYIDHGQGDVNNIVAIMKEMDWYYKYTNYSSNISSAYENYYDYINDYVDYNDGSDFGFGRRYRYYPPIEEDERIDFSASAKSNSLRQWVTGRTAHNNFKHPRDDEDNDQRPPETLWNQIDTYLKDEVSKLGVKIIPNDLKKNKMYFSRRARKSNETRDIIKNCLNDKTIAPVQTSKGVVTKFNDLISIFYDNPDSCFAAVAVHVPNAF